MWRLGLLANVLCSLLAPLWGQVTLGDFTIRGCSNGVLTVAEGRPSNITCLGLKYDHNIRWFRDHPDSGSQGSTVLGGCATCRGHPRCPPCTFEDDRGLWMTREAAETTLTLLSPGAEEWDNEVVRCSSVNEEDQASCRLSVTADDSDHSSLVAIIAATVSAVAAIVAVIVVVVFVVRRKKSTTETPLSQKAAASVDDDDFKLECVNVLYQSADTDSRPSSAAPFPGLQQPTTEPSSSPGERPGQIGTDYIYAVPFASHDPKVVVGVGNESSSVQKGGAPPQQSVTYAQIQISEDSAPNKPTGLQQHTYAELQRPAGHARSMPTEPEPEPVVYAQVMTSASSTVTGPEPSSVNATPVLTSQS